MQPTGQAVVSPSLDVKRHEVMPWSVRRRPCEKTATELLREEPVKLLAGLTSETSDQSIDATIVSAVQVDRLADCLTEKDQRQN